MFRKPRDEASSDLNKCLKPSIGRAPTPPSSIVDNQIAPLPLQSKNMAISTVTPVLGKSQTRLRFNGTIRGPPAAKVKPKANGSILNFFKKTASPLERRSYNDSYNGAEEPLFFEDTSTKREKKEALQIPTPPLEHESFRPESESQRYNENPEAVKRRRTTWKDDDKETSSESDHSSDKRIDRLDGTNSTNQGGTSVGYSLCSGQNNGPEYPPIIDIPANAGGTPSPSAGPIAADDESDDERMRYYTEAAFNYGSRPLTYPDDGGSVLKSMVTSKPSASVDTISPMPPLLRESTIIDCGDGFDGFEDFIDDEFPENGEEFMERRWMEREGQTEAVHEDDEALNDEDRCETAVSLGDATDEILSNDPTMEIGDFGSCPICDASFAGFSNGQTSIHVNQCLDGEIVPLPNINVQAKAQTMPEPTAQSHKRFQRAAIARPGQETPFKLGPTSANGNSAFSRLMSSHAEDSAWAIAATNENMSRGKQAYQRTCPFYKILPGFSICVDAFRYGAVEGCNAYFLSHFHSDHYIGLTSSWCHGPIYCSRVTGNLVRRQLRVNPMWVKDLEFEHKFEVPGTEGVDVTMISANHCPGSSLFLFEKNIGKGRSSKTQRVLHCGDFRACPAHVQHPLLRPDVIDVVTGRQTGQQKLDVCYLDTTYLTPKYAFPSQEDVITACADMCVSLSKDKVDGNDKWEQAKKERAGSGMVKFVCRETEGTREDGAEDAEAVIVDKNLGTKERGRLLVIVGTYSIGKERICLGIARALKSKIYAPPNKQKICAALEDPELMSLLTDDPLEAQVHMQMIMEIRAETLADYLTKFKPHFSRIVGFRPSGWNYRPPSSRFVESPAVQTVLHSDTWKSRYSMAELVPQRGSTREASCFGVPYSEHSSFRELTMFCCALRIDKIIPTVNIGSAKSREKMKSWMEKWAMDKKKNGLFKVADGHTIW